MCVLATEPGKRADSIIKASLAVTFLHLLCVLLHSIRKGQRRTWRSCKTLLFLISLPAGAPALPQVDQAPFRRARRASARQDTEAKICRLYPGILLVNFDAISGM